MTRESSLVQAPSDPATEQKTQVPAIIRAAFLVRRTNPGVGRNGRRQIRRCHQNMVNIPTGSNDRSEDVSALFENDGVQRVANLRLAHALGGLPDVLNCVFGPVAIVDDAVALSGIQELLDVVCALAGYSNDRVDVASLGEFNGECANGRAGSIDDEGNGIFGGCPWERQRQVVVEGDYSSQACQRDSCSFY